MENNSYQDYFNGVRGLSNNNQSQAPGYNPSYSPVANSVINLSRPLYNSPLEKTLSNPGEQLLTMMGMPNQVQGNVRQKYGNNMADSLNSMSYISQKVQELTGKKAQTQHDVNNFSDRQLAGEGINALAAMGGEQVASKVSNVISKLKDLEKTNEVMMDAKRLITNGPLKHGSNDSFIGSQDFVDSMDTLRQKIASISDPELADSANAFFHKSVNKLQSQTMKEYINKNPASNLKKIVSKSEEFRNWKNENSYISHQQGDPVDLVPNAARVNPNLYSGAY